MVKEKKARSLMQPVSEFPRVNLNDTMLEALKVMHSFPNHTSIAIVTSDKGPVGLITTRNILEALEPQSFHISQWSVPVFWDGLWEEQVNELKNLQVRDVYVPHEINSVQAGHNLMRVVHSFNRTKMPAVAVVDGQNLTGIIEISWICAELMKDASAG